jgi:tRNA dimethylallyltransferase
MKKILVVISGPTGIGKTGMGIELATFFNTEVISADSRQIYREMRIGTAVPSKNQLQKVKHHCIHTQSIHDYYNASMFEMEVLTILKKLYQKIDIALLVGGSGMYIDAVCKGIDDIPTVDPEVRNDLIEKHKLGGIEGLRILLKKLDPEYYQSADLKNYKRILKALEISIMTGKPYSSFLKHQAKPRSFQTVKIGLNRNREELYEIINKRVDQMIESGLVEEAKTLLPFRGINALNTVGYKELFDYFDGDISLDDAITLIKRNSRRYAKKQLSWLNRDKEITWFHPDNRDGMIKLIKEGIA